MKSSLVHLLEPLKEKENCESPLTHSKIMKEKPPCKPPHPSTILFSLFKKN